MSSRREWGEFRVDDTPTQNSKNPVESGGVFTDLSLKEDASNKASTVDPTSETDYPSSKAVADYVSQVAEIFNEKIQRYIGLFIFGSENQIFFKNNFHQFFHSPVYALYFS